MAKLKTGRTPRDEAKHRVLVAIQKVTETDEDDDLTPAQLRKVNEQIEKIYDSLDKKWNKRKSKKKTK